MEGHLRNLRPFRLGSCCTQDLEYLQDGRAPSMAFHDSTSSDLLLDYPWIWFVEWSARIFPGLVSAISTLKNFRTLPSTKTCKSIAQCHSSISTDPTHRPSPPTQPSILFSASKSRSFPILIGMLTFMGPPCHSSSLWRILTRNR